MATNEKSMEVLNDLIEINNGRVTGYEKAAEEAQKPDTDLQAIFYSMANDSREYAAELTKEINKLGGNLARGSTNKGEIYQVWMDIKATFSGHNRQSVLESCEFGENAAQMAYTTAIASDAEIDARIKKIITNQKTFLKTAHNLVKTFSN